MLLIVTSTVALDQYSKRQMHARLIFHEDLHDTDLYQGKKDVIFVIGERKSRPKFEDTYFGLNFHYSRNKGAAFSMFSKMPEDFRVPFFNAISILALFVILYLFLHSQTNSWLLRLGLVLIFAGAVGNFIDRTLLGYVIDFIDVEWHFLGLKHDFAVFNVADVAIIVGVFLFIIDIVREWRHSIKEENEKNAEPDAA